MQSETNITELARMAMAGDREAFGALYGLIAGKLYKTAYYTLGNKEDAENAVSDAVLDAWAGISSLRDPAAFQAWIFAILSNKCKRILRDYVKNREKGSETPVEDFAEILGKEDGSLSQTEDQQLVEAAFKVLTEEERQIVSLTVFGEYDSGQIAKLLSLNRNTVRSKYSRALVKMREVLTG